MASSNALKPDLPSSSTRQRQHHQPPFGGQLAPAERHEVVPVQGGLVGVGRAGRVVVAVGDVHVIVELAGDPAHPLGRPRRPAEVDRLGRHDLAVEGPADRRGETRCVRVQVAVRVVGQGPEQRREIVVRYVGVRHQDCVVVTGAPAQHRDGRRHRLQRVVPVGGAVVGDDDRLGSRGQRHLFGGPLEQRDGLRQAGGLQPRRLGVRRAVRRLWPDHDARFGADDVPAAWTNDNQFGFG